jgi:hypothetical protein
MRLAIGLLLFDMFFKDFANLVSALLGISLLAALVIDVRDAESCCVALGPLEVAAIR